MGIYRLLLIIVSPILVILIIKENWKRGLSLKFILQRLGYSYPLFPQNTYWIHCASVGEVNAVTGLIKLLQKPVILTVGTTSGYQVAQNLPNNVTVCALPFDWVSSIKRFLKAANPSLLWVVETEIWPQLFKQCANQKIPITIINARITNKILLAPNWIKDYYRQSLKLVEKVLTKDFNNLTEFQKLGVEAHKCQALGNLKYSNIQQKKHSISSNRPFILLASSHADEEVQFAKKWLCSNRAEQLIIAPRHPERTAAIIKDLQALNLTCSISQGVHVDSHTNVHIINKLGLLPPLFQNAEVVIMGGSFVAKGGHNVLEPASCGAAIISGNHMSNFIDEARSLVEENALIQCADYCEAIEKVLHLLKNDALRKKMQEQALKHIEKQKDLVQKYMAVLIGPQNK